MNHKQVSVETSPMEGTLPGQGFTFTSGPQGITSHP